MATMKDRLAHAWNAFTNQDPLRTLDPQALGAMYGGRPDRVHLRINNERSIIAAIYTRIAIDVASVDLRHVRLDEEERYKEDVDSGLNRCLKVEANIDQGARHFLQDIATTMFDKGVIAIVPTETTINPEMSAGYDILNMRVGHIVAWYPKHVQIELYNEATGRREQITLEKKSVAIVENPFYNVMNEPNSTLQRLMRKLGLLDSVDEATSSGKLDIIIQFPFQVKGETKIQAAEQRLQSIEAQLKNSRHGIAYADATEKITQLNRPAENNLLAQIEYLTQMLYGQLGLTPEIMNGTADEATMINYINRTVEPILGAIAEGMKRSFLSKTAITQGQSIEFYRDPFKLIPLSQIAEIADKFNRNEIATGNDMRTAIGWRPSKDPKADELRNSNMPDPNEVPAPIPAPQRALEARPTQTAASRTVETTTERR